MLAPPAKSEFVPQAGSHKEYVLSINQNLGPQSPAPHLQCGVCGGVPYTTDHCGIPGNEKADSLVKNDCNLPQPFDGLSCRKPFSQILIKYIRRIQEDDAMRKFWETLLRSPVPMGLSRQVFSVVFGTLTGRDFFTSLYIELVFGSEVMQMKQRKEFVHQWWRISRESQRFWKATNHSKVLPQPFSSKDTYPFDLLVASEFENTHDFEKPCFESDNSSAKHDKVDYIIPKETFLQCLRQWKDRWSNTF
ncbi:hypothetical protein TNCV_3488731 [Trichonephila clavipes]|nr:hypothetical protein TNCV_3488731 [Trichonephila clavipes]